MSIKRRDFLKNTIPVAVLPAVLNGISMKAFAEGSKLGDLLSGSPENGNVLVLIQLFGGNDGLNTVLPTDDTYGLYQNARTNVAIDKTKILKLNGSDTTGLHPSMTGMQTLYNEGKMAIVQSVGYPAPNFSHFRSTDIWMTGADSNQVLLSGWVGRYLNNDHPNYPNGYPNSKAPHPLAIQIGSIASLTFQGPGYNMAMSVSNAASIYQVLVNGVNDPAPNNNAGKELTYIRNVAAQTDKYAQAIKNAAARITTHAPYPTGNGLADQLKAVSKLIAGGLKTKVYLVSIGGFDTHSLQTNPTDTSTGVHATLLQRLSDAMKAFQDDLKFQGIEDRVVGMTFSEFGRRVKSNSSVGTDHGAASPLFVFGKPVRGNQILGKNPTIPSAPNVNDNVPMQFDFRSIYATLMQDWLCVPKEELNNIMLKNYQHLPLIKSTTCKVLSHKDLGENLVRVDPNPFDTKANILFKVNGGHTLIQIIDTMGRVVATPLDKTYPENQPITDIINFDASRLAIGLYYVRLQNGAISSVKPIVKAR